MHLIFIYFEMSSNSDSPTTFAILGARVERNLRNQMSEHLEATKYAKKLFLWNAILLP